VLFTPANNDTVAPGAVTLTWQVSSGATSYEVYFGTSSSPPLYATVTGTSTTVTASAGTTYYWTVKAKNAHGTTATSSGTWSFSCPAASATIYGTVRWNGTGIGGIELRLWFDNGASWSIAMTTTTTSSGSYLFNGVQPLGAGQRYLVGFENGVGGNPRNPAHLAWWNSFRINSLAAGETKHGGTFDIADVVLGTPAPWATVGLPQTFTWTRRAATPTDSYEFNLFDPADGDPWWWTALLGYVSSYTLVSLPPNFTTGVQYGWNMWVYAPDGGVGASNYYNPITFSTTAPIIGATPSSLPKLLVSSPLPRLPGEF